jgi:hypothetical protein
MPDVKKECEKIMDIMYEGNGPFKSDLAAYIKSRIPVFSVQTSEERRFITYMEHYTRCQGYKLHVWDIITGLTWINNAPDSIDMDNEHTRSCSSEHERLLAYIYHKHREVLKQDMMKYEKENIRGEIYILLDFQHMLRDQRVIRRLKQIVGMSSIVNAILVGHDIVDHHHEEMTKLIPNLNAPKPQDEELLSVMNDMVAGVQTQIPDIKDQLENDKDELLKKLRGKTLMEAQTAIAINLVKTKKLIGE